MRSLEGLVESPSARRRMPLLRRLAVAVKAADVASARRILRDFLRPAGRLANGD